MEAIEQAQVMGRHSVRYRAAEQFGVCRIVNTLVTALPTIRCIDG
jgi:hypothetical protein